MKIELLVTSLRSYCWIRCQQKSLPELHVSVILIDNHHVWKIIFNANLVLKSISLIDVFANLPGNVGRLLKSYIKVYVLPKLRRSYKTFLAAVSIFQMHHNFDPPKNK